MDKKDNFFVKEREDGFLCLKVRKETTMSDLKELCNIINKGLKSCNYDTEVTFFLNETDMVINISILDEEYDTIGVVELMHEENKEDENEEYYDFYFVATNPMDKTYSETEWDKMYFSIVEELSKILK